MATIMLFAWSFGWCFQRLLSLCWFCSC